MAASTGRFQSWTVEIAMDELWVADGFDLTDQGMHDIMTSHFGHVHGHEVKCKVLKRPADEVIAKLQGYVNKDGTVDIKRYCAERDR